MKKNVVMYIILALYLLSFASVIILIVTKKPLVAPLKRITLPAKFKPHAKEAIAIVNISGPIQLSQSSRKLFTYDSESIVRRLRVFGTKPEVKAIVLRINSPGGSVAAVQEIYQELVMLRTEKNKVLVASFGDIATSGAYYVASACDKIVANPGTITGSIGVILELANVQELFKKIGVKTETIKSGKHKDSGSLFRALTPEEQNIFQNIVNEAYGQFIDSIVTGRKMSKEKVMQLADGRIYTGSQALEAGLIDKIGNDQTAIDLAKELAKIVSEPKIITEYDPWEYLGIILGKPETKSPIENIFIKNKMRFEYIFE